MSSEVQIAVIDQQDTQIVLAVPGVQGATGSEIAAGGTANQVLRKASSTDYDTDWSLVTSAMIEDGAIVDADVNASAAIAGTKISPNFGSQNVVTTGTSTAASFIPTSNTAPTNGLYLPAANNVAISTNGTGKLFVDASGNIRIASGSAWATSDGTFQLGFNGSDAYLTTYYDNHSITVGAGTSYKNKIRISATGADNNIAFHVGTSNPNEVMRLTGDGRLGLGTSSPSTFGAQLAVIGGSVHADRNIGGAAAQVQFSMGASSGSNFGQIGNTGTRWSLGYGATANTIGTEVLVWNSSGNVGIGTTVANSKLSIGNGSSINDGLTITFTGDNSTLARFYANTSTGEVSIGAIGAAYFPTFYSAGSEKARIDTSGRLLVGTSSEQGNSLLQVEGDASSVSAEGVLYLRRGLATAAIGANVGADLGRIQFGANDGTVAANIRCISDGTWGSTSDTPGALVFSTTKDLESSPRERLRISQDGKVSIGLGDTTNGPLQVYNGNSSQGLAFVSSDGAGNEWHFGRYGGDGYFYVIRQTGTGMYMNTNSWVATSDQRAKENIADIESTIDVVKALKPSRFNWKSDGTADVGFVAQQVQPLIPEAVVDSGNPDAMLGITQDKLLPFVVKALQEAVAKIEVLEAKVAALEAQ